jgi:hypothetical protein
LKVIRELFDGIHEIAEWHDSDGNRGSLQSDISAANNTIAKMRLMERQLGAHIAFAHDISWIKTGTDKVLMALLSKEIKETVQTGISLDEGI